MDVRELIAYARFAVGLPSLLRRRLTLTEARRIVLARLERREEAFLEIAARAFYGPRRNPYHRLLELAGCAWSDLAAMVRDRGVEGTLERLRAEGVYVTFEEFKGRAPIVRQGREIPSSPHAFDNPFLTAHLHGHTGGSTGVATRVLIDLDRIWDERPMRIVANSIHGIAGLPTLRWSPGFPGLGPSGMIASIIEENVALRWFRPFAPDELRHGPREKLAMAYIFWAARLAGTPLPRPEMVPLERADVIARAVRAVLDERGACLLHGYLSLLVRVAVAAGENGIDLGGAVFRGGGEAPTPAKVAAVRACGARYIASYAFAESGSAGAACTRPADENDIHFNSSHLALIQHRRELAEFGTSVEAFHFTSLLPTSPKLLLNVQSDDFGTIEERDCGCPFQELGLRRHLRHIRSFRKLTSDGMTLIGSDMVRILEEVLPARFGGGPIDYQLVEEERDGKTRLSLYVHPRLAIADDAEVRRAVLASLAARGGSVTLASAMWRQSQSLEVRRLPPRLSSAGKFSPLWSLGLPRGAATPGDAAG